MKLEALQSLSVVVMFIGLLLSALGGVGAYFFSGGTERLGRQQASAQVESVEPELPIRSAAVDSKLAALTEPVAEVSARQLSLNTEPALAPIPEKPPAPTAPVAIAPVAKKSATSIVARNFAIVNRNHGGFLKINSLYIFVLASVASPSTALRAVCSSLSWACPWE